MEFRKCEPSSLGGLLHKYLNTITYRQLYNHTFVHKQTHKERHICKDKREEHVKIQMISKNTIGIYTIINISKNTIGIYTIINNDFYL